MPWINPVALQIGPLQIHWYGIMYALSFIIAFILIHKGPLSKKLDLTPVQKDNFLIYNILALIIGGRLGYVLFYNLAFYLQNPLKIFFIWEGGMSFHGGLLGIILATYLFSRAHQIKFFQLTDLLSVIAPLGLFFGRIGNFINGELYGRVAQSYCLYFPTDPANCRYPSQLLQASLEGLALFIILYWLSTKNPRPGIISSYFLILYALFRIIAENFREPDPQIGYYLGFITQGQILSAIMLIAGIILLALTRKPKN